MNGEGAKLEILEVCIQSHGQQTISFKQSESNIYIGCGLTARCPVDVKLVNCLPLPLDALKNPTCLTSLAPEILWYTVKANAEIFSQFRENLDSFGGFLNIINDVKTDFDSHTES